MLDEIIIDLTILPEGARYEDRYGKYLEIFKRIAETPRETKVLVISPPWSWVPLLWHLECDWMYAVNEFNHCSMVKAVLQTIVAFDRTSIEVLCGFRPETVDALWKIDCQWSTARARRYTNQKEFIVTTNGSFFRSEVLQFGFALAAYVPTKSKVVLVPCAADKPYPSELHKAVLDIMPPDYYLMNATGVLGLVPQDLWPVMPHYDSGIPYEWRLMNIAMAYFTRNQHMRIVVYCDYYNLALSRALQLIGQADKAIFVNEVKFYDDYIDLLNPTRLNKLKDALI